MCIETRDGVECGPCPDGYTGDGFNCDDVDEVGLRLCGFFIFIDLHGKDCSYDSTF